MIYYFSGAYNQKLKRDLNIDQLFSVYHERKLIIKTIEYKREHPEYTARLMVDSGAYSFYTQMKKKGHILTDEEMYQYTDEYIEFLNEWGDDITVFVAVDSVPDPNDVNPDYARKTWENYLYMCERLRPELIKKLIPVFHFGEDFKWLKNMVEHKYPDGSPIDYIGLAISLEGTNTVRINWANECRAIIDRSSNPNVKTHAFGVGVKSVLKYINVTSTDATSWVKRAAYGMISIDDNTVYISDIQKENHKKGAHYETKSLAYQEAVERTIKERGYDIKELETDCYARAKFNIEDTLKWMSEINEDKEIIHKEELW